MLKPEHLCAHKHNISTSIQTAIYFIYFSPSFPHLFIRFFSLAFFRGGLRLSWKYFVSVREKTVIRFRFHFGASILWTFLSWLRTKLHVNINACNFRVVPPRSLARRSSEERKSEDSGGGTTKRRKPARQCECEQPNESTIKHSSTWTPFNGWANFGALSIVRKKRRRNKCEFDFSPLLILDILARLLLTFLRFATFTFHPYRRASFT